MHASRDFLSLESGQDPAHGRLETFEQASVNIIRIEVGQLDGTARKFELLAKGVREACESKFARRIVRVALASHVTSDWVDVAKVEAWALNCILNSILGQEKHRQLHIRVEVDVHSELETLNAELWNSFALANRMVIDKNMHFSMITNDALPHFFRHGLIAQIGRIEVHVFEGDIARHRPQVLLQLWLEVGTNINDDKVDAVERIAAHKLLGKELSKAHSSARDHNVRTAFRCEALLCCAPEDPK